MAMRMILDGAKRIGDAIWQVTLPPHEIQLLGSPKATLGAHSIVVADGVQFDAAHGTLQVDVGSVTILNLGTGTTAVLLDVAERVQVAPHPANAERRMAETVAYGRGDQEFIRLVEHALRGEARAAALEILLEVRKRWPGDLQRGQRSNFKNTPDNFWYVIVQPRVQSLSITVRGDVERFRSERLELKTDRPGYTRFSLSHPSDVPEAISIIEHSKRKKAP